MVSPKDKCLAVRGPDYHSCVAEAQEKPVGKESGRMKRVPQNLEKAETKAPALGGPLTDDKPTKGYSKASYDRVAQEPVNTRERVVKQENGVARSKEELTKRQHEAILEQHASSRVQKIVSTFVMSLGTQIT